MLFIAFFSLMNDTLGWLGLIIYSSYFSSLDIVVDCLLGVMTVLIPC